MDSLLWNRDIQTNAISQPGTPCLEGCLVNHKIHTCVRPLMSLPQQQPTSYLPELSKTAGRVESTSAAIWFRYIIHIPCVVSSAAQPYHLVMGAIKRNGKSLHALGNLWTFPIPQLLRWHPTPGTRDLFNNLQPNRNWEHTWEWSWITSSQSQGYIKDQDISLQGDNDYCFQIFWWLRANFFPNSLKEKAFTSTEQNIKITEFRQYKRKRFTCNYTKLKLVASLQVFNHWLMFF